MEVNITLSIGPSFAWRGVKLWQDPIRRAVIMRAFWAKVNPADAKGCWLWQGHVSRKYGIFCIGHQREKAHRFAWLVSRGEIPAGQEVCHSCDVHACVNPDHLFLGTHRENHLDSVRKGRKRAWGLQKLNAAQVAVIRTRVATGELHRVLAAEFGVSRNHVSSIVNRRVWAHLDEVPA